MENLLKSMLNTAGITINGTQPFDIQIHDQSFFKRFMLNPSLVAGESYMEGEWSCKQLDELFFRVMRRMNTDVVYDTWKIKLVRLFNALVNQQTPKKSQRVAIQHYNLDNTLYQYMLGESMAYTCAYWQNAKTLDEAQYNKYDLICRKINLQPGEKVLELGCGWGGFAKYATEKYGCEVVAVNISSEQIRYAKELCGNLPVTLHLCDYRDQDVYNPKRIKFDKLVSIGLCEHIGYKNYRNFMGIARENLKDDGLFLLHTIGRNDSANFVDPWINKYIFPNGLLPSIKQLGASMELLFVVEDVHNFGTDYDKTLMAWKNNFDEHWQELSAHYDEKFYRMWSYYLLSCAGTFRAREMQLWQWVLSPKGVLGGYKSVR